MEPWKPYCRLSFQRSPAGEWSRRSSSKSPRWRRGTWGAPCIKWQRGRYFLSFMTIQYVLEVNTKPEDGGCYLCNFQRKWELNPSFLTDSASAFRRNRILSSPPLRLLLLRSGWTSWGRTAPVGATRRAGRWPAGAARRPRSPAMQANLTVIKSRDWTIL